MTDILFESLFEKTLLKKLPKKRVIHHGQRSVL